MPIPEGAKADRIFAKEDKRIGDFTFGQETASVFEDMLDRSVPSYAEIQRMITELAGDFAVDSANPAATRLGPIIVDVSQLQSDNNVRDARIRHDFLESSSNPLVQFDTTSIAGLPASRTKNRGGSS